MKQCTSNNDEYNDGGTTASARATRVKRFQLLKIWGGFFSDRVNIHRKEHASIPAMLWVTKFGKLMEALHERHRDDMLKEFHHEDSAKPLYVKTKLSG